MPSRHTTVIDAVTRLGGVEDLSRLPARLSPFRSLRYLFSNAVVS
jgi:hypothetical protein